MNMNEKKFKNLVKANTLLVEDMLENDSFEIEDLELVQKKFGELIDQLEFWAKTDNEDRFYYELKNHVDWMLKTFSP